MMSETVFRLVSLGRDSEITGTTTDQPTATTNESACRSVILYLFKQQPWGARPPACQAGSQTTFLSFL